MLCFICREIMTESEEVLAPAQIWQDSTWNAALNSGQHVFTKDVDEHREHREEQKKKLLRV